MEATKEGEEERGEKLKAYNEADRGGEQRKKERSL